jgi:hypothetical protein
MLLRCSTILLDYSLEPPSSPLQSRWYRELDEAALGIRGGCGNAGSAAYSALDTQHATEHLEEPHMPETQE